MSGGKNKIEGSFNVSGMKRVYAIFYFICKQASFVTINNEKLAQAPMFIYPVAVQILIEETFKNILAAKNQ